MPQNEQRTIDPREVLDRATRAAMLTNTTPEWREQLARDVSLVTKWMDEMLAKSDDADVAQTAEELEQPVSN